jgi:hypothetical protein
MSVIRIVFEGMMVLFVKNGGKSCDVGILKHAPDHTAKLIVNKISQGDPQEMARLEGNGFQSRLWLDVAKDPSSLKIQLHTDGTSIFDRRRAVSDDFRWALDFEGREMYEPSRVSVDVSAFSSILHINDGTFYTKQVSANQLTIKSVNTLPATIGKVATKLVALITLAGTETASLWNGENADQPLASFKHESGLDYAIQLVNIRHHPVEVLDQADAEYYYTAIASNIAPSRKLHFGETARIDPDARCLTAWASQTELT